MEHWATGSHVFQKQFYYFTIFAHNLPIETCSVGLALILPIRESLTGSVALLLKKILWPLFSNVYYGNFHV